MSQPIMPQKSPIQRLPWLQKRAVAITIALLGLIIILGVITLNIVKYETHLTSADTVLLELAPVDPRGFMQGDYMTLSYALENDVLDILRQRLPENEYDIGATEGYVIVTLNANNVGKLTRLVDVKPDHLPNKQMAIHYRVRHETLKLATNAFFFQEGHAEAFEMAKYGLFRVNENGEPLLTHMVDSEFKVIDPKNYPAETDGAETDTIHKN